MRSLSILVSVTLLLATAAAFADQNETENVKAERVPLVYSGWAAMKRQHLDPSADEDDWIYMQNIRTSDAGEIVKIMDGGKETGYSFQLIEITYEKTNTTVLKLGIIDDATEKTITYIWGEPGTNRLGLNLRWMQIGLTLGDKAKAG